MINLLVFLFDNFSDSLPGCRTIAHSLKDPQIIKTRFTNLITELKAIVVPMNGISSMFVIILLGENIRNVF